MFIHHEQQDFGVPQNWVTSEDQKVHPGHVTETKQYCITCSATLTHPALFKKMYLKLGFLFLLLLCFYIFKLISDF